VTSGLLLFCPYYRTNLTSQRNPSVLPRRSWRKNTPQVPSCPRCPRLRGAPKSSGGGSGLGISSGRQCHRKSCAPCWQSSFTQAVIMTWPQCSTSAPHHSTSHAHVVELQNGWSRGVKNGGVLCAARSSRLKRWRDSVTPGREWNGPSWSC